MPKNTQFLVSQLMSGEAELREQKKLKQRQQIIEWWYGPMYSEDSPTTEHLLELYKILGI